MPEFEKMRPEIKELWVKALRSGEYEQGRGQLKSPTVDDNNQENGHEYCCLGVLTDLYCKRRRVSGPKRMEVFDTIGEDLHPTVAKWAGLKKTDPVIHSKGYTAAQINDGVDIYDWGKYRTILKPQTFKQIASHIEKNL